MWSHCIAQLYISVLLLIANKFHYFRIFCFTTVLNFCFLSGSNFIMLKVKDKTVKVKDDADGYFRC